MITGVCTRCHVDSDSEFLREIAFSGGPLADILEFAQAHENSAVHRVLQRYADLRAGLESDRLRECQRGFDQRRESISGKVAALILAGLGVDDIVDCLRKDVEWRALEREATRARWQSRSIMEEDVRKALEKYARLGEIEVRDSQVKVTAKGAAKLARYSLGKILQDTGRKLTENVSEETGTGPDLSLRTRPAQTGDDYALVDVEQTAMNAIERSGGLDFETGDFAVFNEIDDPGLLVGLLIDNSASMRGGHKLQAAAETALALYELFRWDARARLKVFLFAERVKEIPPWAILDHLSGSGRTDMAGALRACRHATAVEKRHKQVYLITDAKANMDFGIHQGPVAAMAGMMREAASYRAANVRLNIIMLDETPDLRESARAFARRSLGRVVFAAPHQLGKVIVQDYLQ
ncbi:MAG: VWA domain-containing protein [Chloroflexi bacterium]|nr:VWA domain-containing protein [Chloroflexota bacterium]